MDKIPSIFSGNTENSLYFKQALYLVKIASYQSDLQFIEIDPETLNRVILLLFEDDMNVRCELQLLLERFLYTKNAQMILDRYREPDFIKAVLKSSLTHASQSECLRILDAVIGTCIDFFMSICTYGIEIVDQICDPLVTECSIDFINYICKKIQLWRDADRAIIVFSLLSKLLDITESSVDYYFPVYISSAIIFDYANDQLNSFKTRSSAVNVIVKLVKLNVRLGPIVSELGFLKLALRVIEELSNEDIVEGKRAFECNPGLEDLVVYSVKLILVLFEGSKSMRKEIEMLMPLSNLMKLIQQTSPSCKTILLVDALDLCILMHALHSGGENTRMKKKNIISLDRYNFLTECINLIHETLENLQGEFSDNNVKNCCVAIRKIGSLSDLDFFAIPSVALQVRRIRDILLSMFNKFEKFHAYLAFACDGITTLAGYKENCMRSNESLRRHLSFNRKKIEDYSVTGGRASTADIDSSVSPLRDALESSACPSILGSSELIENFYKEDDELLLNIILQYSLDQFTKNWRKYSLAEACFRIVILVMISRVVGMAFIEASINLDLLADICLEILSQLDVCQEVHETDLNADAYPGIITSDLRVLLKEKCIQLLTDIMMEQFNPSKNYVLTGYDAIVKLISSRDACRNLFLAHSCISLAGKYQLRNSSHNTASVLFRY